MFSRTRLPTLTWCRLTLLFRNSRRRRRSLPMMKMKMRTKMPNAPLMMKIAKRKVALAGYPVLLSIPSFWPVKSSN